MISLAQGRKTKTYQGHIYIPLHPSLIPLLLFFLNHDKSRLSFLSVSNIDYCSVMHHPDVDLGNGKVRITVWKDAPEDNDKK